MSDPSNDPTIRRLREQILDNDRSLVAAINTRLGLVARLKRHKDDRGLAFVDPEREALMLGELSQANGGPLSAEGLEELYAVIFDLTKREVTRAPDPGEA